jgi:hypothetical protein
MSFPASIVLIEDDAFKAKRICAFVRTHSDEYEIAVEKSVSTGLLRLFSSPKPDALLIDMSLSTFDVGPREPGGRPQNFGGMTILEHMYRKQCVVPALVITQFETFPRDGKNLNLADLSKELFARFPDIFKGMIYYSSRETKWEQDLHRLLRKIMGKPEFQ